jgi:hypothetical protein
MSVAPNFTVICLQMFDPCPISALHPGARKRGRSRAKQLIIKCKPSSNTTNSTDGQAALRTARFESPDAGQISCRRRPDAKKPAQGGLL